MKLNLGEAIKFGWQTAKSNFFFFLGIVAILIAIQTLTTVFSGPRNQPSSAYPFFTLVSVILNLVFTVIITKISLMFVDGQKPTFANLYQGYSVTTVLKYLGASLLSGLVIIGSSIPGIILLIVLLATTGNYFLSITLGVLLAIVPTIYFALRFGQIRFAIVDKNGGIIESIKYSLQLTKGHVGQLLLFAIEMAGITVLGALALGIGLLWAIPTVLVAVAHVYRQLEKLNGQKQPTPMQQPTTTPAS